MFDTYFIETPHSRLHMVHRRPAGAARGHVLCVPPFGEEMNRARRMLALQAVALCDAGWHVWQPDLRGCGDSAGDLESVTADQWLEDLDAVLGHCRAQADVPLVVLGVRMGAALACAWLRSRDVAVQSLVLWQPIDGPAQIEQLLRLRAAASLFSGKRERVETLRQALTQGDALEVAGYLLTSALVESLRVVTLAPPRSAQVDATWWFELASREDAPVSAVASAAQAVWQSAGHALTVQQLVGVPFWSTGEVTIEPALLRATAQILQEPVGAHV